MAKHRKASDHSSSSLKARAPAAWFRRGFVVLVILAMAVVAGWLAWEPITRWAEAQVIRHLHENGFYPQYEKRSWLPWRGLRLDGLVLYRNTASKEPVVEVSTLSVTFPWRDIWRTRELSSHWHTKGATITLHDAEGAVTFRNVTSKVIANQGDIEIPDLHFSEGAIVGAVSGQYLFTPHPNAPSESPQDFTVNLSAVRAVKATLDIPPKTGPFFIHGTFMVDEREGSESWKADLNGNGKSIVWRDVPLPAVDVHAQLSQAGLNLTGDLRFTHGSGAFTATRKDWESSPLVISGHIADSAGRQDEMAASYNGDTHAMMLASLRGEADLLQFAHSFPALAPFLPTGFELRTFPEVSLTKLLCREGGGSWSLGALELLSPADVTITGISHPLRIDHLTGRAGYDGQSWRLSEVSGNSLGGHFTFSGEYSGGEARNAALEVADVHMKELSPRLGESDAAFGESRLSLNYRGIVALSPSRLTGSGKVRMEDSPVVKMPLLDATYSFFGALSPGIKRSGTGALNSSFTVTNGVLKVSDFTATGESVTVTGSGVVDLVRRQVDGRARANLRGVAGVATRILGNGIEMKISGPLDNIHVQPIGPLETIGQGAVGAVELPGKVLKEGLTMPLRVFDWLGWQRFRAEDEAIIGSKVMS